MFKNIPINPITSGFKSLLGKYSNALIQKPYKTKMITAAVLTAGGDAFCQLVIEKKNSKTYNYRRTFNLVTLGTFVSTPLIHLWYMRGAPAICHAVSNNAKLYPYISMIADQTLISTSSLAMFLFLIEYLNDFSIRDAVDNVKRKWSHAIIANWKVWPPIILMNFLVIPPHFRVLFINILGFFWGIYLSWFQYNN